MAAMNVDHILAVFNEQAVDYLLIGGMNFMLRHIPLLTFDVDVWIDDSPDNRLRCVHALAALNASWGATEEEWGPVIGNHANWLETQSVYCLATPYGAVDVFRQVTGLPSWQDCRARALPCRTAGSVPFWSLSDHDMLQCQYALPESSRHPERIRLLEQSMHEPPRENTPP